MNVLRDAMAVDSMDRRGIYFGTTGGQVYCSTDAGDSWNPIVRDLPAVLSVEVHAGSLSGGDMIRVVLPYHLRNLAQVGKEIEIVAEGPVTLGSVLDALELRYPMLRGTIRSHETLERRPFLRFFACEQDLSHEPPDTPLPERVASGEEPLIILGAIAGGLA